MSKSQILLGTLAFGIVIAVSINEALAESGQGDLSVAAIRSIKDEPSTVYKDQLTIKSISKDHVCGETNDGKDLCIGNTPDSLRPGGTISKLEAFIAGGKNFCGKDERGIHCWQSASGFEKPLEKILSEGNWKMTRFFEDRVCLPFADQTVHCYQPEINVWRQGADGADSLVRERPPVEIYGPFADLRDFYIIQKKICFLDGEHVSCQLLLSEKAPDTNTANNQNNVEEFPTKNLKGARAIIGSWNLRCVLADIGLSCAYGRDVDELVEFQLGDEWKTAKNLREFAYAGVCAESASGEPLCMRYDTYEKKVIKTVPQEYVDPNLEIIKFDVQDSRFCALTKDNTTGKTSFSCLMYSTITKMPSFDNFVDFKVTANSACGVDNKGWVTCFTSNNLAPSPLPEDGTPVTIAGQCRWNSSRIFCSDVDFDEDLSDIKKIIATSRAAYDEKPCLIYENAQGIRKVRCFSNNRSLSDEAPLVEGDIIGLSTRYQYACMYGEQTVSCWGSASLGELPNLSQVQKLIMERDYACASDYFGFTCWGGPKLGEFNLSPPSELADVGVVKDFALGRRHACAITQNGELVCWGDNSLGQLDAPVVTNPTSVAISDDTSCVSADQGVICWGPRDEGLIR